MNRNKRSVHIGTMAIVLHFWSVAGLVGGYAWLLLRSDFSELEVRVLWIILGISMLAMTISLLMGLSPVRSMGATTDDHG